MLLSLLSAALLAGITPHAPRHAAEDSARCLPGERRMDLADAIARANRRPPFADGEELHYSASFSKAHVAVHVGGGEIRFVGRDTVRGRSAWKASFAIDGGWLNFSVHDTTTSWFDSSSFNSLRFVQNLHDPGYHAARDTHIFPEQLTYRTKDGETHPSTADPLDEVSLVYFVRTLPLEPGQCYVFRRYFKPEGNPVVVHVVRRDTVSVPAGRFAALLLRPEITTSGVFSKNGRAELWLADDSTRVVLQLKTKLGFGAISLYLRRIGPEP
jgi:hypothetical protein